MARTARHKSQGSAYYHLCNRVSGPLEYFPFRNPWVARKFMQHVNGEFAKWFNRKFQRRGPFWSDRFRNPELLDLESVRNCLLYIELNAVRAHLVQHPERWKMDSAYRRWTHKKKELLAPLEEFFPPQGAQSSFELYRTLLYYRGAVAGEEGKRTIPERILRQEEKRGFSHPGVFARRLRLRLCKLRSRHSHCSSLIARLAFETC